MVYLVPIIYSWNRVIYLFHLKLYLFLLLEDVIDSKIGNLHFPRWMIRKKESKASLIDSENGNAYAVENGVEKQPIVENKGQE